MKKRYLIALGALSLVALASCGNSTSHGKDFSKLDDETKDALGKLNENLEITTALELTGTDYYSYSKSGYYFYAPTNGNIIVKCLDDSNYSFDTGIAVGSITNYEDHQNIYEIVQTSGSKYKHIFIDFKGAKIYEVETDYYYTFSLNTSSFSENGHYAYGVYYTKYAFSQGDVKFDIYEKKTESRDGNTYEFSTTKFEYNEVVKGASKVGDYYIKELRDTNNTYFEIYDGEGNLDDTLTFENGRKYRTVASYGYNTVLYQTSIPVNKTEKYDYFDDNVYYKLDSYMFNTEKRTLKHLNLDYIVTDCGDEMVGEYMCITYSSIVDGLLEYSSVGLVDEDFDIKYTLKNETDVVKTKGGYFSPTTGKLYDKDFKIIEELNGGSYNLSENATYIIASYDSGKYYAFYDTATGSTIAEGESSKITYYNNMIVKNENEVISYYDVVDGALSLKYKSDDLGKKINCNSEFYCVIEYDEVNGVYKYKLSQYGSSNVLTLYYNSNSYNNFNYLYDNDEYRYYSSSLYTDAALTKHASIIRTAEYILS